MLWENTFIDFDHALNKAVNRVREALNDNADNPQFIETVPRRGYRFIAQVVSQPQGGTSQPEKEPLPVRSSRPVRMLAAALIVVTVCAILAAALFLRPASRSLKITETSQLTSDGHFKDGEIVTDGVRLFSMRLFRVILSLPRYLSRAGKSSISRPPLKILP